MSKYEFNYFYRYYKPIENFEEAKARYESIRPIRGKRSSEDLRPLGERYRWWERIIKISDNEYAVACAGWRQQLHLSFKRNGEIVINGTSTWWAGASITENLISQHLPADLCLTRYDRKIYLVVPDDSGYKDHYRIDGKRSLRMKKVDGKWHVLNPVQEYKYSLSREITKKLYKPLVKLDEYLSALWDMVDHETVKAAGPINWPGHKGWTDKIKSRDNWWDYLISLKRSSCRYVWDRRTYIYSSYSTSKLNRLKKHICQANKRKFVKEPVPIGVPCSRHWLLER